MSGPKAYTMREMKVIVEYLVAHQAYGELKGRKMWVDFSNSSLTNRTWQSLKETFLKRILPDIQNPYYQLTREQVQSFKQGHDVEAKEKNRLENQRGDKEPNSNAENQNATELPSTSTEKPNEEDKTPGEDFKSEKISTRNRSSADTFILEDNTQTTEEFPVGDTAPKKMKECIRFEYSEPPSVVREVLNDFETESESEDSGMKPQMGSKANKDNEQDVFVIEDSASPDNVMELDDEQTVLEGETEVKNGPTCDKNVIEEVVNTTNDLANWLEDCTQEVKNNVAETHAEQATTNTACAQEVINNVAETHAGQATTNTANVEQPKVIENSEPIVIENSEISVETLNNNNKSIEKESQNQNSLNTTKDTIIPNNQEDLNSEVIKTNVLVSEVVLQSEDAPPNVIVTRKRSISQDVLTSKKIKLNNGPDKTNGDTDITLPSSNSTETIFEAHTNVEAAVDNINTTENVQVLQESRKNPCLKSVSLFEEQFNTTKYTDSEDDTPIPKNEVIQPVEPVINNKEETAKPTPDQTETVVDLDKIVDNKAVISLPIKIEYDEPQEKDLVQEVAAPAPTKEGSDDDVIMLSSTIAPMPTKPSTRKSGKINKDSEDSFESDTTELIERLRRTSKCLNLVPGTSRMAAQRSAFNDRNRIIPNTNSRARQRIERNTSFSELDESHEFVSPPRRRGRQAGKMFEVPQSGQILPIGDEGKLYVILGNKAFPLVADGQDLNYVNYDEEEEDSSWRRKYIDEKRKAAELKKQLVQAKAVSESSSAQARTPITCTETLRNREGDETSSDKTKIPKDGQMNIKKQGDSGKIQITLSKNNEEKINLEGQWPQVLPVMQQVMSIFYKTDAAVNENTKVDDAKQKTQPKEDTSGLTTPVLPVLDLAGRKVEELEREIFKEIEEREKDVARTVEEPKANVTRRISTAKSSSSEQSQIPAKRSRRSKQSDQTEATQNGGEDNNKMEESKKAINTRKSIRAADRSTSRSISKDKAQDKNKEQNKPNEVNNEKSAEKINDVIRSSSESKDKGQDKNAKAKKKPNNKDEGKNAEMAVKEEKPVTRSRNSGTDTDSSSHTVAKRQSRRLKGDLDDEGVHYMLPPETRSRTRSTKTTPKKTQSSENPHEISPDRSRNSVDSTQGYQDSDASLSKVNITKRKKKISLTLQKGKRVRTKSFPSVTVNDTTPDSSNSHYFVPKRSMQPTLDSAVYKSESYHILMGNRKFSITKLPDQSSKSDDLQHFQVVSKVSNDSNIVVEIGSSSNVSLPLSPELSVVENLSISREMMQSGSHPTLNEQQANDSVVSNIYNQYLIADVDASVPLMQQDFELVNTPTQSAKKARRPKAPAKSPMKVSDFLNKVCAVNMSANNTLSDTLDKKLQDLLLESAKKISNTYKDNEMEVDEPTVTKKSGKKRCSTPRKRATVKSKAVVGPVLEEHMELCLIGGRQSCPPMTTFISADENANNSADVQLKPQKPRAKKDIIKVKIQRPKKAVEAAECANEGQTSVCTDSGINETVSMSGIFLHGNDNVELIHNHSETCLQARECIGNSLKFIENSKSDSVISLNSSDSLDNESLQVMKEVDRFSGASKSLNAQDENDEQSSEDIYETPATTAFHSPIDAANCSLLTEDLSDEGRPTSPTKWYLLSEDDTNTGPNVLVIRPEQMTSNDRTSNFCANLKQIFPVTCAVPDLSTISEISKENEESRNTIGTEDNRSCDFRSLM